MHVAIFKTGDPPSDAGTVAPSYARMIVKALGPSYTYQEFDAVRRDLPRPSPSVGAYVITGSSAGVQDGDSWIDSLHDWLPEVDPATPLIGICFGHQIMAKAFGGSVKRSRNGWAVGLRRYKVQLHETWMTQTGHFVLPVLHQDQVVVAPPGSRVIAAHEACPFGALSYGDRRALSFQGHPEIPLAYASTLIETFRNNGAIGAEEAARARASLRQTDDCALVMGWIRQFLVHEERLNEI
jgi:GMP synthase-like glutamine amidotransferase